VDAGNHPAAAAAARARADRVALAPAVRLNRLQPA
jgi:hypothetical protein